MQCERAYTISNRVFKKIEESLFGFFLMLSPSKAGLAIECDGPIHRASEQWHHDQIRDAWKTQQGIRVLRFANERVLNDTANVLEEIAKYLPLSLWERGWG